jgi:hypothetical protein
LDPDEVDWLFPSLVPGRAVAAIALPEPLLPSLAVRETYREARRRAAAAARRRRLLTRLAPTATVVLSAAAAAPLLLLRAGAQGVTLEASAGVVPAKPPAPRAATLRAPSDEDLPTLAAAAVATQGPATPPAPQVDAAFPQLAAIELREPTVDDVPTHQQQLPLNEALPVPPSWPEIAWRRSESSGLASGGHLHDGVQFPLESPDHVTWDPANDRVPNRAWRLYGTDKLVHVLMQVIKQYRAAHPDAPRVVVGDLSRKGGGPLDQHSSHQNGLDVDVYYPREDGVLAHPRSVGEVDWRLAQDLVDRFVAAGAQYVFVGYSTPLRGPGGVVQPWPHHDNHMHVRLYPGGHAPELS